MVAADQRDDASGRHREIRRSQDVVALDGGGRGGSSCSSACDETRQVLQSGHEQLTRGLVGGSGSKIPHNHSVGAPAPHIEQRSHLAAPWLDVGLDLIELGDDHPQLEFSGHLDGNVKGCPGQAVLRGAERDYGRNRRLESGGDGYPPLWIGRRCEDDRNSERACQVFCVRLWFMLSGRGVRGR